VSRVFLSVADEDTRLGAAVKQWLEEQPEFPAGEIFFYLDASTGMTVGERWKKELQQAKARCEAMICLVSANWVAAGECVAEYRTVEEKGKRIFSARIGPLADEKDDPTLEWQHCDLVDVGSGGPSTEVDIGDGGVPVVFSLAGLQRLRDGLNRAGIGAEHFEWPPPGDPQRAPYRGWAPLDEADAAVFFGRDAQILRGLDELRGMRRSATKALFVILGPSGCGKSSFLRAGLLPRLRRDDREFLPLPIVRPERAVLSGEHGLAHAIHRLRADLGLSQPTPGEIEQACHAEQVERLRGWLEEARQAARARMLDVTAEQPAPTLVLPVDQAEELFNPDAGAEAPRFLALLASLMAHEAGATPGLIVALTIRADRYEPLQIAPQLAGVQRVLFDELRPMHPAEFKEVITGPADRATQAGQQLTVVAALVDRLLAETEGSADALPLLALTLELLYRKWGGDGDLTVPEYEQLGGMAQVVQHQVDELLASDPEQRQAELDTLHDAFIPWLATINPGNDQPMRRLARWDDLPAKSHPLIRAMVDKRLLVKDTRDGQVVVEVALESLLRQWRELAAWLRDEAQDLKNADNLERDATDWQTSGRDESWLLAGTRLAEAEALAAQPGFRERLDPTRDYLQASRNRENDRVEAEERRRQHELQAAREHAAALRKRSRILVAVLAVTAVIAAVAVALGIQANRAQEQADKRLREETSLRLVSEAQSMLAGARFGGDVRAYQQLLVGRRMAQMRDDSPLVSALVKTVNLIKIADAGSRVFGVAISPDGSRIASGGWDETVRVWDAATGKPVGDPLAGHTGAVWSVAFSPDGTRIASGGWDKTVRVWDAATGKPVGDPLAGHTGEVHSVAFSPDGTRIASGSGDTTVRVWNPVTGKPVGDPLAGHTGAVMSVAFSPDGTRIASGDWDNAVRLWDAATGKPVGDPLIGHTVAVAGVAFSPDGTRIASGSWDETVRVWDAATGKPVGHPLAGHTGAVWSVAFSPDGTRIASGSRDQTVRVWDAATGTPVGDPLTGHTDAVAGVAFSPDGTRIASGSDDHTVRVWDAATGKPVGHPLTGHSHGVGGVAFSPDGARIAVGNDDNTVRVWDAMTGKPVGDPLAGHTGIVMSVAFSPDGTRIASGSRDQTVRVWDAVTGKPVGDAPAGHTGMVMSVAFSPDGTRIASGSDDQTVRVWDAANGTPVGDPLTGHTDVVAGVAFSPDGTRIASGSWDATVRVWDLATGQPVGDPLTGHVGAVAGVAFSPDGTRIASGGDDKTVQLWDAATGKPVGTPLTGHTGEVYSVAFSPDGARIAAGSDDNTVRVWDAVTGKPVGDPLTGHTSTVISVAFSPDGTRIASTSHDGTVRLWPAFPDPMKALCAKLTTNMSHQQWNEWVSPAIDYIPACPDLPVGG
jgi:WD40 repeat protein